MNASRERLNQMTDNVKALGFRMTPQRLAVLKVLAESKEHPSVDEIYDKVRRKFPMTSLATIYKTVTMLKEIGQVMELSVGGGRSRFDGHNPEPHPHLICIRCERITDPDITTADDLSRELARRTGYEIVNQRLDFFGICPDCQEAAVGTA